MKIVSTSGLQSLARALLAALPLCGLLACANPAAPRAGGEAATHWVASWGTAVQLPEPHNLVDASWLHDASLRQTVRLSLGGQRLRVRLTNAYGTTPLQIGLAGVARAVAPGQSALVAGTQRPLRFSGLAQVLIPAGASVLSDPVELPVEAGADLAISLYLPEAPQPQTGHVGSRATSFLVRGPRVEEASWADARRVVRWLQIADVEVLAPRSAGAVVLVGDSITDGFGVQPDTNQRWGDFLALRLREAGLPLSVVNAGISGGRLLRDGLGSNLALRFDRDVLGRAGVTHAIVLIGVNDLGNGHRLKPDNPAERAALLRDLRQHFHQLAQRAHDRGICFLGATLLPYRGSDYYQPGEANEQDRLRLNAWIRESGVFDAVVDFDAALRDPADASRMQTALDIGDHLHPSVQGYRAMAEAVPLAWLRGCPGR